MPRIGEIERPKSDWSKTHIRGVGQGHVYSGNGYCAAFLANIDGSASATVQFQNQSYVLPAWSVSILPDCKNVVFNTAQVPSLPHAIYSNPPLHDYI